MCVWNANLQHDNNLEICAQIQVRGKSCRVGPDSQSRAGVGKRVLIKKMLSSAPSSRVAELIHLKLNTQAKRHWVELFIPSCLPLIPARRRQKQVDLYEFKANLVYTVE